MFSFGLVGCGRIGARHAALIPAVGRLVAVCDTDPARLAPFRVHDGPELHTDLDAMLASRTPDVVAICTPNGLHASQSIAALRAGCHVLCEKPMALSTKDAQAMNDAARAAERHLLVVKQNRYNPPVAALKTLLDEGRLGRLLSVQVNGFWNREADYYADSWHGSMDLDGGMLFTQFSHFIDLVQWFLGEPERIRASMSNTRHRGVISTEDQALAIFDYPDGLQVGLHFTVNAHARNMEGSITVFGEKGTVRIGGQYLNLLEYQDIEGQAIEGLAPGSGANDYGRYQGSMSNHDKVYENLVKVLKGVARPDVTGDDGSRTVRIIERMYEDAGYRMPNSGFRIPN